MTPEDERTAADELDKLAAELRTAQWHHRAAQAELHRRGMELERANARYRRMALWIKADELRKELARTEAEAAKITL